MSSSKVPPKPAKDSSRRKSKHTVEEDANEEGRFLPCTFCDGCQDTSFESLIFSRKEANSWKSWSKTYPIKESRSEDVSITLGSIKSLNSRADECEFCNLIIETLTRKYAQADKREGGGVRTTSEGTPIKVDGKYMSCRLERESFYVVKARKGAKRPSYGYKSMQAIFHLAIRFDPDPWKEVEHEFPELRFQPTWPLSPTNVRPSIALGRGVPDTLDVDLLKQWVSTCESRHGDACHNPKWLGEQHQLEFLRVIDVQDKCIVDAPPDCRYFALSYVWGKRPEEEEAALLLSPSTNETIEELREKGGIVLKKLPKTIADTITFMAAINERFLWVDAFCIIQNNPLDLARQTGKMDLVYAAAAVTIVAAGRLDAYTGLPGVLTRAEAISQKRVNVLSTLAIMPLLTQSASRSLPRTKWASRGWTYQEYLLSRRSLIFLCDQVFWTCEKDTFMEEAVFEPENKGWLYTCSRPNYLTVDMGTNPIFGERRVAAGFGIGALPDLVQTYSEREFSFSSDMGPALEGIANRYEIVNGVRLHWGLACGQFEHGLTWKAWSERLGMKYKALLEGGEAKEIEYPSWS